MSTTPQSSAEAAEAREPHEPRHVHGWLNCLKSQVSALGLDTADDALAGLSQAVDQLVVEHAGMAEELLAVYEQLGVVFEVTRRLPGLHDESAVLDLFLKSLGRNFHPYAVSIASPSNEGGWQVRGGHGSTDAGLLARVERACAQRNVLVERSASGASNSHGETVEIMVSPVFSGENLVCAILLSRKPDAREYRASDMLLLESLGTFCGDLIRNHRLLRELGGMSIATVRALVNAVDQKDPYTCGHSVRVAYFAAWLGRVVGLSGRDLQMLEWAAVLHDVGKIGIRDDVLKKEGKLTPEEMDHIKEHPVRSHRMVREIPQLAGALKGVLHHHERYNGNGYPVGLAGDEIPLQARIIQVADVFDALTSTRSYRAARDWRTALSIMAQEAGEVLDPTLAQTFDGLIRGVVESDPPAWDNLVAEAERFTEDWHTRWLRLEGI